MQCRIQVRIIYVDGRTLVLLGAASSVPPYTAARVMFDGIDRYTRPQLSFARHATAACQVRVLGPVRMQTRISLGEQRDIGTSAAAMEMSASGYSRSRKTASMPGHGGGGGSAPAFREEDTQDGCRHGSGGALLVHNNSLLRWAAAGCRSC